MMSIDQDQCCNAEISGGGGWGIFNALLGWENSATYGSVISYNMYWITIIAAFLTMRYNEKTGHWPLLKAKPSEPLTASAANSDEEVNTMTYPSKALTQGGVLAEVRSVES